MIRGFTVRGRAESVPVGKIVALGRNYRAHAREMGATGDEPPLLFFKPPTALIGHGGRVIRPRYALNLHHELELVIAIGCSGRHIATADALEHVLGYAVGLDMTLRDVQNEAKRRGHPWAVAKGFDTSAPLSPIVPASAVGDTDGLTIELRVNGELKQRGRAGDMILRVPDVVAFVSTVFTLEDGDLIFTGTPEGVGAVFPGDVLEATLRGEPGIEADLRVSVVDEDGGVGSDGDDEEMNNESNEPRGQTTVPGSLPPADARRAG